MTVPLHVGDPVLLVDGNGRAARDAGRRLRTGVVLQHSWFGEVVITLHRTGAVVRAMEARCRRLSLVSARPRLGVV